MAWGVLSLDTMAMCRPPCSQAVTAYLVCLHVLGQSPDQGRVASCACSYAIDLYFYPILDQSCVYIIDQVEHEVHNRLYIYPLCGIFYFPWHRHQLEGTDGF